MLSVGTRSGGRRHGRCGGGSCGGCGGGVRRGSRSGVRRGSRSGRGSRGRGRPRSALTRCARRIALALGNRVVGMGLTGDLGTVGNEGIGGDGAGRKSDDGDGCEGNEVE